MEVIDLSIKEYHHRGTSLFLTAEVRRVCDESYLKKIKKGIFTDLNTLDLLLSKIKIILINNKGKLKDYQSEKIKLIAEFNTLIINCEKKGTSLGCIHPAIEVISLLKKLSTSLSKEMDIYSQAKNKYISWSLGYKNQLTLVSLPPSESRYIKAKINFKENFEYEIYLPKNIIKKESIELAFRKYIDSSMKRVVQELKNLKSNGFVDSFEVWGEYSVREFYKKYEGWKSLWNSQIVPVEGISGFIVKQSEDYKILETKFLKNADKIKNILDHKIHTTISSLSKNSSIPYNSLSNMLRAQSVKNFMRMENNEIIWSLMSDNIFAGELINELSLPFSLVQVINPKKAESIRREVLDLVAKQLNASSIDYSRQLVIKEMLSERNRQNAFLYDGPTHRIGLVDFVGRKSSLSLIDQDILKKTEQACLSFSLKKVQLEEGTFVSVDVAIELYFFVLKDVKYMHKLYSSKL